MTLDDYKSDGWSKPCSNSPLTGPQVYWPFVDHDTIKVINFTDIIKMGLWGFRNGCSKVHVHKKIIVYKVARFWKLTRMHKRKTKHQIGASTISVLLKHM
jgi:hypothetical protein